MISGSKLTRITFDTADGGTPASVIRSRQNSTDRLRSRSISGSNSDRDISGMAPHVFLIGTRHPEFTSTRFPEGSVVIDPWRYLNITQPNVTYVPVGGARAR